MGKGGVSNAWLVKTAYEEYELVVKCLRSDSEFSEKQRKAIALLELRIGKSFNHPNVAQVFDVGELEGVEEQPVPFISMEYIKGMTLDEWRFSNTPSPLEAKGIVVILARTLQVLHTQTDQSGNNRPICHFDLKPANVMVADPKPKNDSPAEDKGQAAVVTSTTADSNVDSTPSITPVEQPLDVSSSFISEERLKLIDLGSPSIMTPGYAAPERYRDNSTPGASWDIFALGGILYFLLMGDHPLSTKGVTGADWEKWLQSMDLGDADLTDICRKCLAWNSSERFATSKLFAESLDAWANNEPIPHLGRTYSWWHREKLLWKRGRKYNNVADHRQIIGRIASVVAAALIATAIGHVAQVASGVDPNTAYYWIIHLLNAFCIVLFIVCAFAVKFNVASLKVLEPLVAIVIAAICLQHFVVPRIYGTFPNWQEMNQSALSMLLLIAIVNISFGSHSPEWKIARPVGWITLFMTFFLRPLYESRFEPIAMPVVLLITEAAACLAFVYCLLAKTPPSHEST